MPTPPKPSIEVYLDAAGEHRWRLTAANGEIIGASSEGFKARASAVHNARLVWGALERAIMEHQLVIT